MANEKTEADTVSALTLAAQGFAEVKLDRNTILLAPVGMKTIETKDYLDKWLTNPERRKGTAIFTDLDSFIAHVNRFKNPDSAIFADSDENAPSLTSVIDYHVQGADADRTGARWLEHRGSYSFPLSKEWQTWKAKSGQPMGQASFADFIETNILDVIDIDSVKLGGTAELFASKLGCMFASPSALMTVSRGLAITVNSTVKQVVNLDTGAVQIGYTTEHRDGLEAQAPLTVPNAFLIGIRVFRNGDIYQVPVRLRYRQKEGSISWHYELYRPDLIFDDAFETACKKAGDDTGVPVFQGQDEGLDDD